MHILSRFSERLHTVPANRETVGTHAIQKKYCDTPLQVGCCLSTIAVFLILGIIGTLTSCGLVSGVVAGGVALGLGFPLFIASILSFFKGETKQDLASSIIRTIFMVGLLLVGALATAGVIGGWQIGGVMLFPMAAVTGAAVISISVGCLLMPFACCYACLQNN